MQEAIYEIPSSVREMFEQGERSYKIIDYGILDMNNNVSLQYFLGCIGAMAENIVHLDGTMVIMTHPDFKHNLEVHSGGLGDFYSHGFDVKIHKPKMYNLVFDGVVLNRKPMTIDRAQADASSIIMNHGYKPSIEECNK